MQSINGRVIYSASDITNYLECEHLIALDYAAAFGEIQPPDRRPAEADLSAKYGMIHEQQMYTELRERGYRIIDIPPAFGLEGLAAAAQATVRSMRDGATHIAQATFFDGRWLGRADLLVRVEQPSDFGAWSYEVLDAKLARRAKPNAILQLCFYSDQLARIQGLAPKQIRLYLGTGHEEHRRFADFAAYYRQVKRRFEDLVATRPRDTYPEPVPHCAVCRWNERCQLQRETDDHLSLVAGIRRDQIGKLESAGISTMAALATAPARPASLIDETFKKLRSQAELQHRARRTNADSYELLEPQEKRGFARLPKPSPGDVFFDMEGHPYIDTGLEYLFGVAWRDGDQVVYRSFWAHDHIQEKRALEEFVRFIEERRMRFPDLHIYHYAPYEPSALKRLMTQRGACEDEIDDWLRHELFVDLYQVVHQALRASRPGYGLKEIESFYGFQRGGEVAEALQSIRKYEEYLAGKDQRCLNEIEDYNRQDCESAMQLRDWLLARRDEAVEKFAVAIPFLPPPPAPEPSTDRAAADEALAQLKTALLAGMAEGSEGDSVEERARWLTVQLLDYHRREAKPVWWAFYDRQLKDPHELIDDADSIGDLSLDRGAPLRSVKRSTVYTFQFPPQQHRLTAGDVVYDPSTGKPAGTIDTLDDVAGRLELRRATARASEPLPRALMPGGPIGNDEQRGALRRLGQAIASDDASAYRALRDILTRAFPRITGFRPGDRLQGETADLERTKALAFALDDSYLFIQGPPGSGKTYTAAHLAVHLMRKGKRIGVTSTSHKAINNLLREIERVAREERFVFRGLKKSGGPETEYGTGARGASIRDSSSNDDFPPPDDVLLIAGTAWLFARADLDGRLDYLFLDEAGQISLADALATGTSARNIILLGDPLQLAQVSLAAHPDGAGASVLEHLLGEDPTVAPDRGVFLEHTRRLHPAICAFIAEIVYGGRLQSAPGCERRSIASPGLTGTGLRFIAVEHEDNSQRSEEEAAAIADAVKELLRGTFTDADGVTRALTADDILIVTPYNMQMRCLRDTFRSRGLPGMRVGTVDKFQGQEAPVVFYSMATSSGDDLPRNLEFLFSRNRLNVAVSRAQCMAVLVASPRLLDARCRTVEQVQMVNALCRLVEFAKASDRPVLDVPEIRIDGLGAQPVQIDVDGVNIL